LPNSFGDALGVYAKYSNSPTTSFGPCTSKKQLLQRNDSNPIFGAPFTCPPLVTNADMIPGGVPLYASNLLFVDNSVQSKESFAESGSPLMIGISDSLTATPPHGDKRRIKESQFEVVIPQPSRGSKALSIMSSKRYRSPDDEATIQSTDRVTLPMSTSMSSSGGSLVSSGHEGATTIPTQLTKNITKPHIGDTGSFARITPEIHDFTVFSDTNQAYHSSMSVYRSSKRPLTSPYPHFKKPTYDDFDSPDENDKEMETIVAEHEQRMKSDVSIAAAVAAYANSPNLDSKSPEKNTATAATASRRSSRKRSKAF
jgi:hypothetical protein